MYMLDPHELRAAVPQAAPGLYLDGIGTQKSGRRRRHRGNTSSGAVRAGNSQHGHGRGVSAAHLHQESGFDFTLGFCTTSNRRPPPQYQRSESKADGEKAPERERGTRVTDLVKSIKGDGTANLSSAVRLFVLGYYQDQIFSLQKQTATTWP
jgi:hypothetical protein